MRPDGRTHRRTRQAFGATEGREALAVWWPKSGALVTLTAPRKPVKVNHGRGLGGQDIRFSRVARAEKSQPRPPRRALPGAGSTDQALEEAGDLRRRLGAVVVGAVRRARGLGRLPPEAVLVRDRRLGVL